MRDFELIETMLWREGRIPLLAFHLDRLRTSALYFEIPYDEQSAAARIEATTSDLAVERPHRVRLTLSRAGEMDIAVSDVSTPVQEVRRVRYSQRRVDSGNVFCYHKTTHRSLHEEEYRQALEEGFTEVIFLNERGEVTEGSRTNVFVRTSGVLLTPPISSGLLAGVYRRHLLVRLPEAAEQVLYPEDLLKADAILVCNAVWGLVEVHLDPIQE